MKHIYLDYAATSPVDERVMDEMIPYYSDLFGNADSVHSFGRKAAAAVDHARRRTAALLGAKQSEIYFTSGGTEANNWAIKGAAEAAAGKYAKSRIITSVIEHASVLAACAAVEKRGVAVTYLPVSSDGFVRPEDLSASMDGDVALVSIMSVNNETGCIQPVRELAAIAHSYGALFHTDAVQAACLCDLRDLAVCSDMMSLSAHKFYGPKGSGALYVRSGTKIERLIEGGEQERTMRGGTVNVPAVIGFDSALSLTLAEREQECARLSKLSEKFIGIISEAGDIYLNGTQPRIPGIINVRADGINDDSLLHLLDLEGVACSAGAACSSGSAMPSHVLLAMGLNEGEARGSIRVSFGRYTTEADIEAAAEIFIGAVRNARSRRKNQ